MSDVSLFGMNPGGMHAVNLALHTCAAVLLFFALRRLTGTLWEAALVAALFGLHPINVESVAWVAERKNVLCATFTMAVLLFYQRYTARPDLRSYSCVVVMYLLALLSKPMAVTLPAGLLLLDIWPLKRHVSLTPWRLVWEKMPLFALSLGASLAQMQAVEPVSTTVLSLPVRLSNGIISYALYIWDLAWPSDLGVFYPHQNRIDVPHLMASLILLVGITLVTWLRRSRQPYLIVGWLWFLGSLVPMIGIVQVGSHARADRFTYIAQIGIFVAVVWTARALVPVRLLTISSLLCLALLVSATARQVGFWIDSVHLFEHTARVTAPNPRALALAGYACAVAGDYTRALPLYEESLRLRPHDPETRNNYGAALTRLSRDLEALEAFGTALQLAPEDAAIRHNVIKTMVKLGRQEQAVALLRHWLKATPEERNHHHELGMILTEMGELKEGTYHLRRASGLAPSARALESRNSGTH
jgi:Flp pilus assembly protein TadD